MKSEFALAFNEITERFGLSPETVMETLEAMMVSAYRRAVNASSAQAVEAKVDPETGDVIIFAEKEIVEEVENPLTEVIVAAAHMVDAELGLGDMVMVESTPDDFGRVAAQTAKQVMLQRLREAERDAQYEEFAEREGDMVHGTVHSITPQAVTVGLGRAEAILPRNQQIPGERFHVRDRIRVYVLEVRKSSRGPVIVVSRTHPNMLRRLLEMEVPEISQGLVEIKAIAREAGKRAKVAVAATREGVDPVGACVGLRGVRIQSIVRDLNDEKIDVIEWNPDPGAFIAKALSPARVSGVFLEDNPDRGKTALVVVPEDQLSLAIGRAGVNARLGAKLTNWRIDIKSLVEAASDSLLRLNTRPDLEDLAESEQEVLPQIESILIKKEETRPVTPEEYQVLTGFIQRVQGDIVSRREAERQKLLEQLQAVQENIPPTAYEVELVDLDLSTRVLNLMVEAGYVTAGKVFEQLELDPDQLTSLPGIGPKAVEELTEKVRGYPYPEPEPEPEPEVAEALVPTEEQAAIDEAAEAVGEVAPETEVEVEVEAPAEEEAEAEAVEAEAEPEAAEIETPITTMEEALESLTEVLDLDGAEAGEEDLDEVDRKAKVRTRYLEFDPETGAMVVHRRRKPGRKAEWEDGDSFDEV